MMTNFLGNPFGSVVHDKLGENINFLHSTDLDEARELVSGIFCAHQLNQVSSGIPLQYSHLHIKTRLLGFSSMSYGADVRIDPGPLHSFYLVQIPLVGHDNISSDGSKIVSYAGCASVHSPHRSLGMLWSADCKKLVIRIDKEALERYAESLIGERLPPGFDFTLPMETRVGEGGSWVRLSKGFFDELCRSPSTLQSPLVVGQFEQMIMSSLLQCQPNTLWLKKNTRSTPDSAPVYVRKVEEYIESNCHRHLTLEDIVNVACISGRSLFAAFKKHRDISPMQHLRNVRMGRAHQDLANPYTVASVTEIATRWGFFELGRFAAEYKNRFGEYPSATLKRSR